MAVKLQVATVGGIAEITGADELELIRQANFWCSLPIVCPICDEGLTLTYMKPDGRNEYYGLACTGSPSHTTSFGKRQEDGGLYYKGLLYKNPTDANAKPQPAWQIWDEENRRRIPVMPGGDAQSAPKEARVSPTPAPSEDTPPWGDDEDVANELFEDNQMVSAFLAVAYKMGFSRQNVEKGAQIYYKTMDLNSLSFEQIQQLTERMRAKAEKDGKA